MRWLCLSIFFLPVVTHAQVFAVTGGDSSVYQAQAAQITMFTKTDDATVSIGDFGGHIMFGASEQRQIHGWDTTFGDKNIGLLSGGQGISAPLIGVFASRSDAKRKRNISFFVGAIGEAYYVPYGFGQTPKHFGTGYSFTQIVGRWGFGSVGAIEGGLKSLIGTASFQQKYLQASFTGGLLQNSPVWNEAVRFQTRNFGADVNQQTLILYTTRTNVATESVYGTWRMLDGHAGLIQSHAGALDNSGEVAGVGLHLHNETVLLRSDYYGSRTTSTLVNSATERVRKFTLIESEQSGEGRTSFNFGAGYASNRFSASVTHQELFYPLLQNPWQRTLSVNATIRLPHNSSASLGTIALPNAGIKFTAYGGTYAYRNVDASGNAQASIGKYEIAGTATNEKGEAVSGAKIKLGKQTVYSGDDGTFSLHVGKEKPLALSVLVDDFLEGEWTAVKAPATATPGTQISIIVRRK